MRSSPVRWISPVARFSSAQPSPAQQFSSAQRNSSANSSAAKEIRGPGLRFDARSANSLLRVSLHSRLPARRWPMPNSATVRPQAGVEWQRLQGLAGRKKKVRRAAQRRIQVSRNRYASRNTTASADIGLPPLVVATTSRPLPAESGAWGFRAGGRQPGMGGRQGGCPIKWAYRADQRWFVRRFVRFRPHSPSVCGRSSVLLRLPLVWPP